MGGALGALLLPPRIPFFLEPLLGNGPTTWSSGGAVLVRLEGGASVLSWGELTEYGLDLEERLPKVWAGSVSCLRLWNSQLVIN